MSQKNHEMIDGKLLQTDKKYAQLKLKQKEKIAEWMFQATRDYYMKKYTFPNDKHLEEVVDIVYEKIEDAEIWIPYGEVFKHYKSKRSDINKRIRRSLNEKEESRIEKVCFMNMCMIQDDKGNVLAFLLLYWTGMRIGELLALTYNDINLEEKTISINKSYQRLKGKDMITQPKTPKSIRVITMPDFLAEEFREYCSHLYGIMKKERLFRFTKSHMEHCMATGIERSGVKRIRLHDLRHSHASMLVDMGVAPLEIAERLGHEKVETTLNTYSHLYPSTQSKLAGLLDKKHEEEEE